MSTLAIPEQRQRLLSVLALSPFSSLLELWPQTVKDYEVQYLRAPETGMVMLTGRAGATGEPFNVGEVAVSRCALSCEGQTGIGYVQGRALAQAEHIALLDALFQNPRYQRQILEQVVEPLQQALARHKSAANAKAAASKVEFFTLVRGDNA